MNQIAEPITMQIDYSKVPVDYMVEGVRAYIEYGDRTGDFLHALISNDLFMAFAHADAANTEAMPEWSRWFYNEAPSNCWKSPDAYHRWIERGGLRGRAT
jgi:hypothetical protein